MAQRRWFTSDQHFGHLNMARWRGFPSLGAMHATLVRRWYERVEPDDEVYVLGDAAMGRRDETLVVFGQLHGRKFLVPGNHDYCGPWSKKADVWAPVYARYFELLPVETNTLIAGHEVTLCHFPFGTADHTDSPRFLHWRPEDRGQWLVHGHTHGHFGRLHDGRQVDVGVEGWDWGPVSEEQLAELVTKAQPTSTTPSGGPRRAGQP